MCCYEVTTIGSFALSETFEKIPEGQLRQGAAYQVEKNPQTETKAMKDIEHVSRYWKRKPEKKQYTSTKEERRCQKGSGHKQELDNIEI